MDKIVNRILVVGIFLASACESETTLETTTDVTSTTQSDATQTPKYYLYENQSNITVQTSTDDATHLTPEPIEIGIETFVTEEVPVKTPGWDVIETPVVKFPTVEAQSVTTSSQYDETQSAEMVSSNDSALLPSTPNQSEVNLQVVTQSAPLLHEEYFQSTVSDLITDDVTLETNSSKMKESNTSSNITVSPNKGLTKRWRMHIKEEKECLKKIEEELIEATPGELFCPRVWDELLCWPPADPGTEVFIPCKESYAFSGNGNATRYCQTNGKWAELVGEKAANGWSNYNGCIHGPSSRVLIYKWLPTIKRMSKIGYSLSLVILAISFSILICLRKLRCPRNILHLHLFFSFMMRAVVVLFKGYVLNANDSPFQPGIAPSKPGPWWCRLLIAIWQYFILANYSWILMEGLYLHNLIFRAMFTDSSSIRPHVMIGWGLPFGCVSLWSILKRALDNKQCWTINHVQWIFWLCIRIPVAVSNFVNFFFFVHIIRELYVKMRSTISAESTKYKKLAKSTLVLVPLFGVHYFLLWGLSTSADPRIELIWLLLDQVFSSFQGFFVAILYCLMNSEVRMEFKKLYGRYREESLVGAESAISSKAFFRKRGSSLATGDDKFHRRKSSSADEKRKSDGHAPLTRLQYTTAPNDQTQENSTLLNHRTPINNGHHDSMV